jgi:hypothetical protein
MAIAKTNRILADGYNLASALKSIAPEIVSEELDATYLSSGARVYEMGYDAATVDAQGFFANDGTNLDRIHNILSLAFKNRTTQKLTAFLQDYAFGGDCVMLNGCETKFTEPIDVNSVIMTNAKWRSTNGLWFGKGYISQSNAAGTITSASIDNGAASSNGGLLHVHLDNNAATSVTAKIQHATDNSTWVDLVAISTMTGVNYDSGTASVAIGTTIRQYTRAVSVVTGGAVDLISVAFARN